VEVAEWSNAFPLQSLFADRCVSAPRGVPHTHKRLYSDFYLSDDRSMNDNDEFKFRNIEY